MAEEKFRLESDLLGELKVPVDAYYGVQTQRGINNYHISRKKMRDYPDYIIAIAYVKLAAIQTNHSLGVINDEISGAISKACQELIDGKLHENFPIDMMQGGAGTSVNMNANEVIANRSLEIMGHKKGEYQYCYPNDHVNCGQSTNDVYPTSIRLAIIRMNKNLVASLTALMGGFTVYALSIGIFIGWLYWVWMAIQLGSFSMFVFGLLGPFALISSILGIWSFLFGIPGWLLHLVG